MTTDRAVVDASSGGFRSRIWLGAIAFSLAILGSGLLIWSAIDVPKHLPVWGLLWLSGACAIAALLAGGSYIAVTISQYKHSLPFEVELFGNESINDEALAAVRAAADRVESQSNGHTPAESDLDAPSTTAEASAGEGGHGGASAGIPTISRITDVVFYKRLIQRPADLITRISEFVEPHTASQKVRTSFTIELPDSLSGRVVVPLLRTERRKVVNGLRFYGPNGERVSSLTQVESIGYLCGVIRTLIRADSAKAFKQYVPIVETEILSLLLSTVDASSLEALGKTAIPPLRTIVQNLLHIGLSRQTVRDILILVTEHVVADVVCIAVDVPPVNNAGVARSMRLTVERADAKRLTSQQSRRDMPRAQRLVLWDMPKLREYFGVETTIYQHSLEYAERCGSYHLQIAGPKGTYLAKQALQPDESKTEKQLESNHVALEPRHGQRFSHLYIHHDGTRFRDFAMAATFYERPPGTIVLATLSAFAALVIASLCGLRVLWPSPAGAEQHADLVAVLLAFPPAIAVWAGFGESVRQTLSAHLSRGVTIASCGFAAYLYVQFPELGASTAPLWAGVSSVLLINTLASGASLVSRMLTYGTVRKSYHYKKDRLG